MSLARRRHPSAIGVVLAGGAGLRLGGEKATVSLGGRPLISYPIAALREVVDEVVVLAEADTTLPALGGVTVWVEPDEPRHPLVGLRHALGCARPRPVLVCAQDLPFVAAPLLRRLCAVAARGHHTAVLAAGDGIMQPLLGWYGQAAAARLTAAPAPGGPLRATVAGLRPHLVEVDDPAQLVNVNTPEDLLAAAARLDTQRAGISRR